MYSQVIFNQYIKASYSCQLYRDVSHELPIAASFTDSSVVCMLDVAKLSKLIVLLFVKVELTPAMLIRALTDEGSSHEYPVKPRPEASSVPDQ